MKVNSSLISEMERMGDSVVVTFKSNGSMYQYQNIPDDVWNEWVHAPSQGQFYLRRIKNNPDYPGVKL